MPAIGAAACKFGKAAVSAGPDRPHDRHELSAYGPGGRLARDLHREITPREWTPRAGPVGSRILGTSLGCGDTKPRNDQPFTWGRRLSASRRGPCVEAQARPCHLAGRSLRDQSAARIGARLASARSEETSLRNPCCARFPTPLDWPGEPEQSVDALLQHWLPECARTRPPGGAAGGRRAAKPGGARDGPPGVNPDWQGRA